MFLSKFVFYSIFLFLNFFILYFDIKEKKIPNKILFFILLLFFPFFLFGIYSGNSLSSLFFIQLFISIISSFTLYYFGIWSAGDAKYLLILSLFLLESGIIPFIVNIALITLIYLFIYFLYFYTKVIINKNYRKSLWENIWKEQKDKILTFLKHPVSGKIEKISSTIKILKQILYFLIFFISLRLFRLDIMNEIEKINFIKSNISLLKSYFVILIGGVSFFIIFLYRFIFNKIKYLIVRRFLEDKIHLIINEVKFKILNLSIALFFLFFIIIFDYLRNGYEVFHKIEIILTTYLGINLLIRILFYSYKVTFQIGEQTFILIKNLREGYIIDKSYLINIFGTQACLGYKQEKGFLSPNPGEKIQSIENPIDEEGVKLIKKIYSITNNYHKKNKTPNFSKLETVKILKTFAFGPYIFAGFLITIIFGDLVGIIMWYFENIFTYFFHH